MKNLSIHICLASQDQLQNRKSTSAQRFGTLSQSSSPTPPTASVHRRLLPLHQATPPKPQMKLPTQLHCASLPTPTTLPKRPARGSPSIQISSTWTALPCFSHRKTSPHLQTNYTAQKYKYKSIGRDKGSQVRQVRA